jgi:hypothetical protein
MDAIYGRHLWPPSVAATYNSVKSFADFAKMRSLD